jgi:hypothetical protein
MIQRILAAFRKPQADALTLAGIEARHAEWKRTKSTQRQHQLEREMRAMRLQILRGGK